MAISDYMNDILKGRDIESDRLAGDRSRNLEAFRQFTTLFPDASAEDFARFADAASGMSAYQRNSFPTQQTFDKLSFFNQQKRAGDLSQLKLNEVKRQEEEHQVLMNVLDRAAMFATNETDWLEKARTMGGDQLSASIDKFMADKPTNTLFQASIMKQAEPYVKTAIAAKMSPAAIRSILPNSPALQKAVLAQVGSYYQQYAAQVGAAQAKAAEGAFGDMVKMMTAATGDTSFLSRLSADERSRIVDTYVKTNPQAAQFKDMFTKRLEALGELQSGVLADKQTEQIITTQATAAAQRSADTLSAWAKKGPADFQKDYGFGENEAKQMVGKITQLLEATKGKEKGANDWVIPPDTMRRLVEEFKKDPVGFGRAMDADIGSVLRSVGALSTPEYQIGIQRQLQEMRGTYRAMTSRETVDYFQTEASMLRERAARIRAAIVASGIEGDGSMIPQSADYRRMLTEYNDIVRRYQVLQERARDLDRDNPVYIKDKETFRAGRKDYYGAISDALSGLGTDLQSVGALIPRSPINPLRPPATPANRTDLFSPTPAVPDAAEVRLSLTPKTRQSENGLEIEMPSKLVPPLSTDGATKVSDLFTEASKDGLFSNTGKPITNFIERSPSSIIRTMYLAETGQLDPASTAKIEQIAKQSGYNNIEQLKKAYRAKFAEASFPGDPEPWSPHLRRLERYRSNPDAVADYSRLPAESRAGVRQLAEEIIAKANTARVDNTDAYRDLLIRKAAEGVGGVRRITIWSNYNSATGKGTPDVEAGVRVLSQAVKDILKSGR